MALATYTFLPWLRQGLGNSILEAETSPNPSLRASLEVELALRVKSLGDPIADRPVSRTVRLYGPGDVLGVERAAIVKTEPRDFITNFEPNNLAFIEFYDEDFPWRYTPARADSTRHRHRPWLALLVLEEGEFRDGNAHGKPLPCIELPDLARLPPSDELWAWAHVHVNRNLGVSETVVVNDDRSTIVEKLRAVLSADPDLASSRLLSPRKLAPNRPYHAFLIPSFESGRVAGLGLDVSKVDDAMRGAWDDHPERGTLAPSTFPYYYRWYFHTGDAQDFESLVRLLEPKQIDPRVGRRELDVQKPAQNLAGIPGPNADGVLRLGGALRVPDEVLDQAQIEEAERFESWDEPAPHPFQRDLAAYINLAADYRSNTAEEAHSGAEMPEVARLPNGKPDPDPIIVPPLYGRWHALTERLLTTPEGAPAPNAENWVHELNLDPRHRAAAGLGTKVVRDRQEDFMNAAWKQVGQVLEANRKTRQVQFSFVASYSLFARHLAPLARSAPSRFLALSAPLAKRVVESGATAHKLVVDSRVPLALTSVPMRRILRPSSRVVRKLVPGVERFELARSLFERVNDGTLEVAQAPALPSGAASLTALAESLRPSLPAWLAGLARSPARTLLATLWLTLILALLLLLFAGVLGIALALVAGLVVFWQLSRLGAVLRASEPLLPENQTVAAVDAMPSDPSFSPRRFGSAVPAPAEGPDSVEAVRFKGALRAAYRLAAEAAVVNRRPERLALDTPKLATSVLEAIDPARVIPSRLYRSVRLPERVREGMVETFVEAMMYPRIDEAMYRPLCALGSELFLPNIGLIAQNSISLLVTNQRFIESYMVGLNHEFARELLWREYPTDQRGSYFRQFWDATSYADDAGLGEAALREKLYDIPRLHRWSKSSRLGDHDHRQPPGSQPKDEVVLAIRGELLKRYPTAVIYAHRAAWQRTNGRIDKSLIRVLAELTPEEEAAPPRELLKTPLYEAKVEPDITFFGFDLTVSQAKGNPSEDDPGWFFVIKERPGEPRFGLDLARPADAPINTWSDLSWNDVTVEQSYLRLRPGMQTHALSAPPPGSEGPQELEQHLEDRQLRWNSQTNSADVAYVLYQLPVLVAVHAAEMLP